METITYKLAAPVSKAGIELKEVKFSRRLKASDFRGLNPADTYELNSNLISRLTNTEMFLVDEIDGYDYMEIVEIVKRFLASGPSIGKGSSAA